MKKKTFTLLLGVLFCLFLTATAQTLFYENFTPKGIQPPALPEGWTTIENPEAKGHWITYDIQGDYCLYCQETELWGTGHDPVKKEYAITPEITIPSDQDYGVKFLWVAQSIGILDKGVYDFHLAITEDNGTNWEVIFSASKKEDLEKSGILFPWANWSRNPSIVSLNAYKGKKIKIGFIYETIKPEDGNMLRIHEVEVMPHTLIETPIVAGSTSYSFTDCYLDVKEKSMEPLYIINKGIGELNVLAIEGLNNTDFSTDLVPGEVALTPQSSRYFNVYYTPTETGARETTMTIKTNGGDHQIKLTGTKTALPAGYTLESFEGDAHPPLGWSMNGAKTWSVTKNARSGEKAVEAFFEQQAILTSPRLDLSTGTHQVTFDYSIIFGEEEVSYPENDFYLELSVNGGSSWTTKWTEMKYLDSPYTRTTVSLGNPGSDNCLLRWVYKIDGQLSYDVVCNTIVLDNIVLPPLHGTDNKPDPATQPTPADGSKDQYATDLKLSWRGSLHADQYKLYVGTDQQNPTSIVNGAIISKGEPTQYILNELAYKTTYYWKVIASNNGRESENNLTWSFTTMEDNSIVDFPYFYGFEDGLMPPLGWTTYGERGGRWNNYKDSNPYEGNYSVVAATYGEPGTACLQMPEILVPADKDLQITFVWGNAASINLIHGEGSYFNNGLDSITFEVKAPGEDWEKYAVCSQATNNKVWMKEKVFLEGYRGKRIAVRWKYEGLFEVSAKGAALDNVEIDYIRDHGVPVVSYTDWYAGKIELFKEWNAGIVNYRQILNPGEIFTLANEGAQDLRIKSVSFDTEFFTTTLAPEVQIKANESIKFGMALIGKEHRENIKDNLKIEFTDGQTALFPVQGSSMGQYSYCYTFEEDTPFTTTGLNGLKTVDEDGLPTVMYSGLIFEGRGTPYAYLVMNWEMASWHIYPRSGKQLLLASGPDEPTPYTLTKNWLITNTKYTAMEGATLRFYAKSYGTDWGPNKLTVLVSTTDNQISSFTALPTFTEIEVPLSPDYKEFTEYIVDLSQYKDQQIYIAILHNTEDGLAFFMDDIYLENFRFPDPGSNPPVFLTEPVLKAYVGQEYVYNFALLDLDDDPLIITVKGVPGWMTYTPRENGGILTGTPTESGKCLIKIEVTDGTHSIYQEFEIEIEGGDGIQQYTLLKDIMIYPNPVTDLLYIDGKYDGVLTLTDISGKVIYTGTNVTELSVDGLAAGIYMLRIESGSEIYTTKITKIRF